LPASLKHLTFGRKFNQPLQPNVLPSQLKELTLYSRDYTYAFEVGVLPHSLQNLRIRYRGPELLPGVLPSSLSRLEIDFYNPRLTADILPHNLKHMKLSTYYSPLPELSFPDSLRSLEVRGCSMNLHPSMLPSNLEVFEYKGNQICSIEVDIGAFPPTMKKITLGNSFNQSLKCGMFPQRLRILH
jgi:hypothetical protein